MECGANNREMAGCCRCASGRLSNEVAENDCPWPLGGSALKSINLDMSKRLLDLVGLVEGASPVELSSLFREGRTYSNDPDRG